MGGAGEFKKFHVRDGYGIVSLLRAGIEVAFISGRRSDATEARAVDLGVKHVVNGAGDKLSCMRELAVKLGVSASEAAFIGDDIPDISCIRWAGLGIAVNDAAGPVREAADIITAARGGKGAVREAAEYILRTNGDTE
jgi:3-deoxy-D-manno-octulosonate 8-phosphate phosphatase (KDO 8-P phosphatase)